MKKITALFFFITIALVVFLFLYFKIDVFGATIFEDDFESYNLGNINGQGGWSDTTDIVDVVNDNVFQGEKAGHCYNSDPNSTWAFKTGAITPAPFEFTFKFYVLEPVFSVADIIFNLGGGITGTSTISTYLGSKLQWNNDTQKIEFYTYDFFSATWILNSSEVATSTWHTLTFEGSNNQWRAKIDTGEWSIWNTPENNFDWISRFTIFGGYLHFYFDQMGAPELGAPEFRVYGISPVSGTEITSTSTEFSFGWEGLATSTSYYQGFWLNFREKTTGIKTEGYLFTTAEPTGTATTSLENFNFVKNSDYYLTAVGAGYTYGYYTDLVSPEFYYTINIAGLPDVFKMTDFSTWYSENSKFATPTAIFVSLTGFLEPVFSKIGEFGERTTEFFDLDDAYTRGYDIGIIFPTFTQYINEIEVFMGGFPIIRLFLVSLIVLLGIFIIKLIMKFIPFFG